MHSAFAVRGVPKYSKRFVIGTERRSVRFVSRGMAFLCGPRHNTRACLTREAVPHTTQACFSDKFTPKSTCSGCGEPIPHDAKMEAFDSFWHRECLKCCVCQEVFTTEATMFSVGAKVYCEVCVRGRVLGCVSGQVVRFTGCLSHLAIFPHFLSQPHYVATLERCFQCVKPITGEFFTVGDNKYHLSCLVRRASGCVVAAAIVRHCCWFVVSTSAVLYVAPSWTPSCCGNASCEIQQSLCARSTAKDL